jgi:general secretion pathway protein D
MNPEQRRPLSGFVFFPINSIPRRTRVKKTAALLLLMGLVSAPVAYAQKDAASGRSEVKKNKGGEDFVTLNFSNIDISALIKVMSELTRRNFILDERVTGKVTLMTPTRISPDEAYQVFLSALEIKGFTAIEDGSVIRIIPSSTARQSGLKVLQDGDMRGEGFVTKLIRLNFVSPQELVRTITPLVSKDGSVIAHASTNSIIITDPVSNLRKIESLIHAMDVAAPEGKGRINVYYLKHANSEDIAKIMQALVARLPVPPAGAAAAAQPAGPSTILEGTVTISSDKATNSLIIVGSADDFQTMKDVIQKLDIRRRQVYVETAIIEMSLTKQRELGFEMQIPINQSSFDAGKTIAVGGTNFGTIGSAIASGPAALASTNGLAVGAVKGTFTFNGQEFLSVGALLHALQTDGNVNVLSTPNILTMDNQKAEIMVGQNVPFTTGQTQNATTGSTGIFNTIERKDVGIKLTLTPQITSDDNVRLEVNQEISDVVAASTLSAAGLITNKRSANTTVVVKDRQTMVIGGLIRDNVVSTTSKVPFLGDIPILGWFFKSKSSSVEKTNLMIFITPFIIKNEDEAGELTRHKNAVLEDFRKEYRIEKKSSQPALQRDSGGAGEQPAPAVPEPPLMQPLPEQPPESAPSGTVPPAPEQNVESSVTTTLPPPAAGAPGEDAR